MDWTAAIDKNREALKRILAMFVAMAEMGCGGLGEGGRFAFFPRKGGDASRSASAEKSKLSRALTLPRHLYRAILRMLRPAEAAARRLIIVAARGLNLPPPRQRNPALPRKAGPNNVPPRNPITPALPLFDPLPRWNVRARPRATSVPRISVPGFTSPFPITVPRPDDLIDASRLVARLAALAAALDDLPVHAKRFARWRARAMRRRQNPPPPCEEGLGVGVPRRRISSTMSTTPARARRLWPLRPGWPPGWRRKPVHEVHEVLDVVHGLAHWVLVSPDTS